MKSVLKRPASWLLILLLAAAKSAYAHEGHQSSYGEEIISQGQFVMLQEGRKKSLHVAGWVQMVRRPDGYTDLSLYLEGLKPDSSYPVYIHTQPCEQGAGAPYKINPYQQETSPRNTIRALIKSNRRGIARTKLKIKHWARPEAQSLVIHDPRDNSNLACADIFLVQSRLSDNFGF